MSSTGSSLTGSSLPGGGAPAQAPPNALPEKRRFNALHSLQSFSASCVLLLLIPFLDPLCERLVLYSCFFIEQAGIVWAAKIFKNVVIALLVVAYGGSGVAAGTIAASLAPSAPLAHVALAVLMYPLLVHAAAVMSDALGHFSVDTATLLGGDYFLVWPLLTVVVFYGAGLAVSRRRALRLFLVILAVFFGIAMAQFALHSIIYGPYL